ncbi:VanZ family protein [Paenibacillus sp. GCM10027628]|uniref:VanZ family protein n=1 Tax=Paenibacillus sp. GCM10027628 TaxID=3273413 RepID=UPI0036452BD4
MRMPYRVLLVCLWFFVLVVLTCTVNLEALFYNHTIEFTFNLHPQLSELLKMDLTQIHPKWVMVKFGHFLGFGMMDVLLFNLIRKQKPALFIAILLAVLTEICQLYFNRDGRLYDVAIDSAGIFLSHYAIQTALLVRSKMLTMWNERYTDKNMQHFKS